MKITSEEDMAKIITGVKVTYQGMPDKDYVFDGGTYTFTPLSDFTMDFLKQNIYDSILSMLFDDSNEMYGHSESLSGYEAHTQGLDYEGYGFGIDKFEHAWAHFELVDKIEADSTYDDIQSLSIPTSDNSQQQIDDLQNQLTQQQNKVKADQDKVNADKQAVANDQNQIKQDTPTALE